MSKYFNISKEKEFQDSKRLADLIIKDDWIDKDTIIVVCSPDYSGICCQVINHKLSYTFNHELLDQLYLEMPYPTMSQIFNMETSEYQPYDRYLKDWINSNIHSGFKYLFIDSATCRGKNFAKLKSVLRGDSENFKFASVYLQDDSIFIPDYFIQKFNQKEQGGILFEWENPNNPNWNY